MYHPTHSHPACSELALMGALSLRQAPLQHGMTALTLLDLSSCSSLTSLTVDFHNPLVCIHCPCLPLTSPPLLKRYTKKGCIPFFWFPGVNVCQPSTSSEAIDCLCHHHLFVPSPRTKDTQPMIGVYCMHCQCAPFTPPPPPSFPSHQMEGQSKPNFHPVVTAGIVSLISESAIYRVARSQCLAQVKLNLRSCKSMRDEGAW